MRGTSYSREHNVILLAELEMIHYTYARCDSTTTSTVTLMWWPRDSGWPVILQHCHRVVVIRSMVELLELKQYKIQAIMFIIN